MNRFVQRRWVVAGPGVGLAFVGALLAWACSSSSTGEGPDAGEDVVTRDVTRDTGNADTSSTDTALDAVDGGSDVSLPDSGGDTEPGDAPADGLGGDAPDDACPDGWMTAPTVVASITVPDGGGGVLLHAAGVGTQDYTCDAVTADGGVTHYTWTFVGPEAELNDCHAALIGHHFASDGGPTAPEWQTLDGTYVVGQKVAAFTPDGGAASVPWLLLHGVSHGGSGTLSNADYVQRLNTDGGIAPDASACTVSATGTTVKVPYSADYFFFGP